MLKVPATFDGYSSRADGSLGLRFTTQEVSDTSDVHSHVRKFGWLLFDENDVQAGDVPKEEAYEDKSPSKRMRDVLFVLYKQTKPTVEFETWYRAKMDLLIEHIKSKLDPL